MRIEVYRTRNGWYWFCRDCITGHTGAMRWWPMVKQAISHGFGRHWPKRLRGES